MDYRMALDLGTASTALANLLLDAERKPIRFAEHHAIRIFDEPTIPDGKGKPKSKKALRRAARTQRRQIERRSMRLREIARLGPLIGLNKENIKPDCGQNLPGLRAQAARHRVELEDFFRILLRLAKRRGYYGVFKLAAAKSRAKDSKGADETAEVSDDDVSDKEAASAKEVLGGSQQLAIVMKERAIALGVESITLGEYLFDRTERSMPIKLKIKEIAANKSAKKSKTGGDSPNPESSNLYALNALVQQEFDAIWRIQSAHHPILSQDAPDGHPIRSHFQDAIFFKRPLRSPAAMVGKCMLEKNLPRAPRAQMAYQTFRIEKTLADIRWGIGKAAPPLSYEQKTILRKLLSMQKQVSFSAAETALAEGGHPKPAGKSFNLAQTGRATLHGNTTLAAFRKLGMEGNWLALSEVTQVQVINFLADLGSPEQLLERNWPKDFVTEAGKPRTFSGEFIDFMNALAKHPKFDRMSKMGFDGGRASYSIKAMEKLTSWLNDPHWREETPAPKRRIDEEAAIDQCFAGSNANTRSISKHLERHRPTGNTVIDVALREVHRVVNENLRHMGSNPSEIIVELGREMAMGLSKRAEQIDGIKKNTARRDAAIKEIEGHNEIATPTNIDRYLLAQEQGFKCPYCQGQNRFTVADVVDGSLTNFEHILPKSLTQVRRKRSELMLAHRSCNDAKGDNTPFMAWGEGRNEERWHAVEAMIEFLETAKGETDYDVRKRLQRKAKLLNLRDFEHEVLSDESIEDFADRQMHQTSWIAKLVAEWLKSICPNVFVARGEMTAYLRNIWGLNTVVPELRYAANLPVLDTDGKLISKEDFDRYRSIWEGRPKETAARTSRMPDKRIDHRHHLIDACVIALSDRSLFQAMARHYKGQSERAKKGERVKLWLRPLPLIGLREQVLNMAKSPNLTHKPDRNVAGAFFQKTAYRKEVMENGDSRLSLKIGLQDLADKTATVDGTRKNISDIVSEDTRRFVSDAFELRVAAGKTVRQALAAPIIDPRYRSQIKTVRVFQKLGRGYVDGSRAVGLSSGQHYLDDGYAYVSLRFELGKLSGSESVTRFAARNRPKRPGQNEVRVYSGDTLQLPDSDAVVVIEQILANATLRFKPHTESRVWAAIGSEGGAGQLGAKEIARAKPV
jgi:CRISPR-associated endonuclease Csn1